MIQAKQAQKKAVKMAAAEAYRSKKPGECLKVSGYRCLHKVCITIMGLSSGLQSFKHFMLTP
jgi:hypothetical protein